LSNLFLNDQRGFFKTEDDSLVQSYFYHK